MKCRECGFSFETQALFCPNCGARLVLAESAAPREAAAAGPVQSPVSQLKGEAAPAKAVPALRAQASSAQKPVAAKAKPVAALQPGDVFAGRYRIEKFLGQGSLCNAYLCRDSADANHEAVLKIMHARKAQEHGLAHSFVFLAESVAKYDHKGIAKTLAWGDHEGVPFYTMEWVPGMPLRMWLLERLTFENRVLPGLGILLSLLDIFEAVHERGCYGSLKPENVFVTLSGPVIMDFGVVGFLAPQEFEFNAYARRYLPYMAPELRQDWSNLIPHSDFYSLGALLYEILVGRAPAAQLRVPSEMSDIFGIEADEIILKAMAPKPMDRFGTLEAFRRAVEELQASLLNARAPAALSEGPVEAAFSQGEPARLQVASDAFTVHNPEVSFATPPTGTPVTPTLPETASPNASWTAEPGPVGLGDLTADITGPGAGPEAASDGGAALENPYGEIDEAAPAVPETGTEAARGEQGAAPAPAGTEAAHAQRRFARAATPALVEKVASEAPAPDGKAWESLAGGALPKDKAEPASEPVPAWLWISLALAGCSMVVLSAYFGLLMPR